MCVIVAKPVGADMPTFEELQNCFQRNSDGAGYAYVRNGKVIISKGFMSFKPFYKAINKHKFGKNENVIMHFRIGTHGTKSPNLTHPYPLSSDLNKLRKCHIETDIAVAHNGIISMCCSAMGNDNDTTLFIRKYMARLIRNEADIDENMCEILKQLTGSKLAFLTASKIYMVGAFEKHNGCYYSNPSYEKQFLTARPYYGNCNTCNQWSVGYGYDEEYVRPYYSGKTMINGVEHQRCEYCGALTQAHELKYSAYFGGFICDDCFGELSDQLQNDGVDGTECLNCGCKLDENVDDMKNLLCRKCRIELAKGENTLWRE